MAKADGSFDATAPVPSAHAGAPLALGQALVVEERLGWASLELHDAASATAVSVSRLPDPAGGPDLVDVRSLAHHGGKTWLNALEGLGVGPGAVARRLGLTTLLRPVITSIEECLADRVAFAPGFSLAGDDYRPDRWENSEPSRRNRT